MSEHGPSDQDEPRVVHDREASRYEVYVGDELAGLPPTGWSPAASS